MISIQECEKWIEPKLGRKRFFHSQCVSQEAVKLAKRYGADPEKAAAAGMLHDICKEMSPDEQLKIIERFGIMMSDTEKAVPKLYHAISGAAYVQHEIGLEDEEILSAIRWHTSGRKGMGLLEKVIFVADFNSADRDYPGVETMRELAESSLEEAMLCGLSYTIAELVKLPVLLDLHTIEAYNDVLGFLTSLNQKG